MIYVTKQPSLHDDSTGQAGAAEVEVTAAMVEAAMQPFRDTPGDGPLNLLSLSDIRESLPEAIRLAFEAAV